VKATDEGYYNKTEGDDGRDRRMGLPKPLVLKYKGDIIYDESLST
jgi:hypothetical protein